MFLKKNQCAIFHGLHEVGCLTVMIILLLKWFRLLHTVDLCIATKLHFKLADDTLFPVCIQKSSISFVYKFNSTIK